MNAISIKNVYADVGEFQLRAITLDIPCGCVTGCIGRNGAGKTTLMNTMMGLQEHHKGKILFSGKDIREDYEGIMNEVAYLPSHCPYGKNEKVKALLRMGKPLYPDFDEGMFHHLCQRSNIDHHKKLQQLSLGQQKLVQLYLLLARKPKTLILDEPMANLDPITRIEIVELLRTFMIEEDHTIFISSHILSDLEKLADYMVIIDKGAILLSQQVDILTETYKIIYFNEEVKQRLPQSYLRYMKKEREGYSALCEGKEIDKSLKYRNADMEDILYYLTGGVSNVEENTGISNLILEQ